EEAVKLALQIPWSISLDVKKATSKVDHPLYDTVASETPNPEEDLLRKEEQRELTSALEALHEIGPRSAKIITLYYGLGQAEPMTLDEIGACLGITRERVRQIRNRTLMKLRTLLEQRNTGPTTLKRRTTKQAKRGLDRPSFKPLLKDDSSCNF